MNFPFSKSNKPLEVETIDGPEADSLLLNPYIAIVDKYTVTKNGVFSLTFELPSFSSIDGIGNFDGLNNAFAKAIGALPPLTSFQYSILPELVDPEEYMRYFIERGKGWESLSLQLGAEDEQRNQRDIKSAKALSNLGQSMGDLISKWFDAKNPTVNKSYITISWKIPSIEVKSLFKKEEDTVTYTYEDLQNHLPTADQYLLNLTQIFVKAFGGVGLQLRILAPQEALQVNWRVLNPAFKDNNRDNAQRLAEDIYQGQASQKKAPPDLHYLSSNLSYEQLSDVMVPNTMQEYVEYMRADDSYLNCWVVYDFQPDRPVNLQSLNQLDGGWSGVMYITIPDKAQIAQKMDKKSVQSQAKAITRASYGRLTDFANERDVFAAEKARADIAIDGVIPIYATFFVMQTAPDIDTLSKRNREMESLFKTLGVKHYLGRSVQRPLWEQFLLTGQTTFNQNPRNLTADSMANFFWPTIENINDDEGIYFGVDNVTKLPILQKVFGDADELTPVFLTLGTMGSGKSVSMRSYMAMCLFANQPVFAIDIEGELKQFCEYYGGRYIELGGDEMSSETINALDVPLVSDSMKQQIKKGTEHLIEFVEAINGRPIPHGAEFNALENAYKEALKGKGWIDDETEELIPENWNRDNAPLLEDILTELEVSRLYPNESKYLANMIRSYAEGIYADDFNVSTSFDISNEKLVIFGLSNLSVTADSALLNVTIWQIMTLIWGEIVRRHRSDPSIANHVFFDEAWALLDSANGAKLIENMARRFRKYRASLSLFTQQVNEFIDNVQSQRILSIVGNYIVMRQNAYSADKLARSINLHPAIATQLGNLPMGTGYFITPEKTQRTTMMIPSNIGLIVDKAKLRNH
jgi:hypothetical protein